VQRLVSEAHARFKSNTEGENSQVYPALARVPSDLFGVCVVGTSGRVYAAGDVDHPFSIMSVSKPFVFALVCEIIGPTRRATSWERAQPGLHSIRSPPSSGRSTVEPIRW
jgi:glutaminase